MVFKTKIEIGGYPKGSIVPKEKADIWAQMYAENPTYFEPDTIEDISPIENLDLNKDGQIDKKDASVASKILNSINKQIKGKGGKR